MPIGSCGVKEATMSPGKYLRHQLNFHRTLAELAQHSKLTAQSMVDTRMQSQLLSDKVRRKVVTSWNLLFVDKVFTCDAL